MSKEKISITGINFLEALFLLFLGLKLGNVIDWSWWWVFAPIWLPLVLVLIVVGGMFLWIVVSTRTLIKKELNDKSPKK